TSGTRVIEPLPAFATQAAPKPIATATGSVPTTSSRKTRLDTGFVAISRLFRESTVQTSPAPRTTRGGCGRGPRGLASVSSVLASNTSSEFGSTRRGVPPITKRRSSAAATIPPTKISASRIVSRLRVRRVGCRARPLPDALPDAVFDNGSAGTARFLHHRRKPGDELERLAVRDEALQLAELVVEPGGVDRRPRDREDLRVRRRSDGLAVSPQL